MLYGSKFVETGAGIGHNIDTLLVGIAVQARWVVARGVNKISPLMVGPHPRVLIVDCFSKLRFKITTKREATTFK